jgi:hypothetical protein
MMWTLQNANNESPNYAFTQFEFFNAYIFSPN